jgi:hypothetical protein
MKIGPYKGDSYARAYYVNDKKAARLIAKKIYLYNFDGVFPTLIEFKEVKKEEVEMIKEVFSTFYGYEQVIDSIVYGTGTRKYEPFWINYYPTAKYLVNASTRPSNGYGFFKEFDVELIVKILKTLDFTNIEKIMIGLDGDWDYNSQEITQNFKQDDLNIYHGSTWADPTMIVYYKGKRPPEAYKVYKII